jgi:hypothetical protein
VNQYEKSARSRRGFDKAIWVDIEGRDSGSLLEPGLAGWELDLIIKSD